MGQRRLQLHRRVGRDHAAVAAQFAHQRGWGVGGVEFPGVGVEVQDALGALVVLQAQVGAQLLQHAAAVAAQLHDLADVVAGARGCAFTQELQAPQPLAHVGTQAEQQRRVFTPQPLQQLQRRTRVGPGLGMADRHLPAVGKTGFRRGAGLAVDHGDLVALLLQEMGGADAEQAGAQNEDVHGRDSKDRVGAPAWAGARAAPTVLGT